MSEDYKIEDVSWTPSGASFRPEWIVIYDDRDLTLWERIRIRWFRGLDPRVLYHGPWAEAPVVRSGEVFTLRSSPEQGR
jgi:hypothetical protein